MENQIHVWNQQADYFLESNHLTFTIFGLGCWRLTLRSRLDSRQAGMPYASILRIEKEREKHIYIFIYILHVIDYHLLSFIIINHLLVAYTPFFSGNDHVHWLQVPDFCWWSTHLAFGRFEVLNFHLPGRLWKETATNVGLSWGKLMSKNYCSFW